MSKKYSVKIQKAINEGRLIPYEDIFNAFSPARQKRIQEHTQYLQIAYTLRNLRKTKKLSQEALAKKMNVKREFISRIESGTQNITLNTLYRIGAVMGKEVEVTFK
jgi:DNA-binding XRE family transcriptional regulator